jgi:uncharacterized OB-fold protein
MQATTRPIAPGLFTWPSDEPRLLGSRCSACGLMAFPAHDVCPRCGADDVQEAAFSRRGTLWTYTTQEFVPKSPPYARGETEETFEPYAVGYVEFPGEARIEGRIVGCAIDDLAIGMEMEVTVVPFIVDDRGEVVTYAFRPAGPAE